MELQNSLCAQNLMIFSLVQFVQIDITYWALGNLQKIESNEKRANLEPNGVLQFHLYALTQVCR